MKIGFLCSGDPRDKNTWSGTMYKMYSAIEELGHDVVWISAAKYSTTEEHFFEKTAQLHEKLLHRTFNRHQTFSKAWLASRRMQKKLDEVKPDLLFAIGTINEVAFLQTHIPIVYINDILYDQHINYYPAYQGLGWLSKKTLRFLERKALKKCTAVILPSEWSIDRAHNLYDLAEDKLYLLRFGANIDVPEHLLINEQSSVFTLLFLAVEWERKGGDIALETVELLKEKGYPVQLKVVGCVPPVKSELMEVIPFLSKNDLKDYWQLKSILAKSDLLLLPTRAECYGIVFCEASAYGLPSIATATGGVTSIVKDGINGYALPIEAKAADYSEIIEPFLREPRRLRDLRKSSRNRYDESLSWEIWQEQFQRILTTVISNKS